MKPVINLDEIEFAPWGRGAERPGAGVAPEKFKAELGYVAPRIGAQKLGYNVTIVPPGKAAFPAHAHRVNEEMFFVLEGSGEVRIGDKSWPIRQGDFIACPPGGPETAHQIFNSSLAPLKFLAVSTMMSPEIAEYPDSGKIGSIMPARMKTASPRHSATSRARGGLCLTGMENSCLRRRQWLQSL